MESIIVGFIVLLLGGINVVRPGFLIGIQIWTQKVIMGAKYIPSPRTYFATRIIGAFLIILGLLIVTGFIK